MALAAPGDRSVRSGLLPGATVLVALIAVLRVVTSYPSVFPTFDEPYHLLGGMEWLESGKRTNIEQPPLAQVAVAIGPYLKGLKNPQPDLVGDAHSPPGNFIFSADGEHVFNVWLARLGVLPFLVLGCAAVYLWGARWFSAAAGILAAVLFTCLPPILGHGGVATTDLPACATLALALYQLIRWMETPTSLRALLACVSVALAVLTKFSSLGFISVSGLACLLLLLRTKGWTGTSALRAAGPHLRGALLFAPVFFILLWAGYRFTAMPISDHTSTHPSIDSRLGSFPMLRDLAYTAVETPLPLAQVVVGLRHVGEHNARGHASYLLGEYGEHGWWYFFPVVLLVKTPLPFLALTVAGGGIALMSRDATWQRHLTALIPLGILAVCMTARINLGVRHVLPIYPFLAILAGHAVARSLSSGRFGPAGLTLFLAGSVIAESVATHPHYLAYFNQLVRDRPEEVLAESDLDWGQDLHRLGDRLYAWGVRRVSIRYFGTAPLDLAGLPPYSILGPAETPRGWVAISVHYAFLQRARDGSYGWVREATPVERIGRSILLYHFPEASPGPRGLPRAR